MFSATSLVLRSRRSLISAAGTASWIGTYINNPTNRAFFTPHSFVLRCFLSTTPDKDTSDSVTHMTTKKKKKTKMKVGDSPINILPKISSVIHSADLGTSVSAKSSDTNRRKPIDRDERMADLEEMIKNKDVAVMNLSKEVAALFVEQLAIRRIPEASRDSQLLFSIEEVIANKRIDKARLVAEIAKHEVELSELKNPKELVDAPVPAQGI